METQISEAKFNYILLNQSLWCEMYKKQLANQTISRNRVIADHQSRRKQQKRDGTFNPNICCGL